MKTGRNVLLFSLMVLTCVFSLFLPAGYRSTALAQSGGGNSVLASPTGGEAPSEEVVSNATGLSWKRIMKSGRLLMYVLFAMSFLTVTFVIYFLVVLRPSQIAPPLLLKELVEKIRDNRFDEALRASEFRPCPLSAISITVLKYMRNVPEVDPMLLKDVLEGEGMRQAESIQGQTQYLMDIAAISPMVGLLGTVFGMLRAFSAVALDIAQAKPIVLADGVSQALITTAFGLIVGIPAMVFYAYFRRRASKMVSYLESASVDLLTALSSKR